LVELFASRRKSLRCFLLYRKGLAMTRIITERRPKGHRGGFMLGHYRITERVEAQCRQFLE
jgi:hypothetical protein